MYDDFLKDDLCLLKNYCFVKFVSLILCLLERKGSSRSFPFL